MFMALIFMAFMFTTFVSTTPVFMHIVTPVKIAAEKKHIRRRRRHRHWRDHRATVAPFDVTAAFVTHTPRYRH